jgi:hypothetical protein
MTRLLLALFALSFWYTPTVHAQGVIPVALAQQSDLNGRPLSGALLYIYQVGTTATPQNTFQDFGLTMPYPWPLRADQYGRIPMFYLANGQVHARLTDATGVVLFDIPNMQVIGPSSGGGGGGGGTVDPAAIFATGDFKWRPTSEVLVGWVKANGQTVGNIGCIGCSGRANADVQNLYVYLWAACSNAHCPVPGGRGTSGIGDFNALKPITLPDMRGRGPMGLDDMDSAAAGRILPSNVTSGGGDTATTPAASGGTANHTLAAAELAVHSHPIVDVSHTHTVGVASQFQFQSGGGGITSGTGTALTTSAAFTGITTTQSTCAPACAGNAFGTIGPFLLGSWHIKL